MAKRVIEESTLTAIADAIREKGGTTAGLDPEGEMPQAILDIKGAEIEERDNSSGGKTVYINSEAPEESVLPEGFTRLKYIQSEGRQYADTGFTANQDTRVVVDFQATTADSDGSAIFGSRIASGNRGFDAWVLPSSVFFNFGSTFQQPAFNHSYERMVIDANKNVATFTTESGKAYTITNTASTFTTPSNLLLCSCDQNGTPFTGANALTGRVYSGQIYDNGAIARNYIPCLNASGEAGLWDTVTQAFFGDAAGVGFIAGPVVGKGVSKVVLEDEVLIDLAGDTISPETVLAGFIGHDKTGAQFVGELVQKAGGRPVATGSFSSSAASHSITGLAFAPKIVFVIETAFTSPPSGSIYVLSVYYNSETGNRYQYGYGTGSFGYGNSLSNLKNDGITLSGNGFSVGGLGLNVNLNGTYNWVAIGAEE